MSRYTIIGGDLDEVEAAAAIAALTCLLEEEAATSGVQEEAGSAGWQSATKLLTQGLSPARLPNAPSWGKIERLRRAGRGATGIVGQ